MAVLSPLLAAFLLAQAASPPACDAPCERAAGERLIEQGELRSAVDRLRAAVAAFPDDPTLPLLLARAYLLDDNLFWAERTLREAVARRPEDAAARSWLASVHLRQGDPDLARADLPAALAPTHGPDASRWHLLEALRDGLDKDAAGAAAALSQVPRAAEVYPEDRSAWLAIHRLVDPTYMDPLAGSLELRLGRTSNALAGSPIDPSMAGMASDLADLELHTHLVLPREQGWRPAVDLDFTGHGLQSSRYRELSTADSALRLGAVRATGRSRLLLGYRAELLRINQADSRFSEAHRGELELETGSGLLLFGGGGRRRYRDERRTRWEGDGGIGGTLWPGSRVPVAAGATIRLADASSQAYDQVGASIAAAARITLGHGFAARAAATLSWDDYPHSGGREGLLVFGSSERRRDLMGRLALDLLAPTWHRLRPGLEVELSHRDSTLDHLPVGSYGFTEWRAALLVRYRFATDPWAPRAVQSPGHIPLDWRLARQERGETERILELLRQDEDLRRGSSCSTFREAP